MGAYCTSLQSAFIIQDADSSVLHIIIIKLIAVYIVFKSEYVNDNMDTLQLLYNCILYLFIAAIGATFLNALFFLIPLVVFSLYKYTYFIFFPLNYMHFSFRALAFISFLNRRHAGKYFFILHASARS